MPDTHFFSLMAHGQEIRSETKSVTYNYNCSKYASTIGLAEVEFNYFFETIIMCVCIQGEEHVKLNT